MYGMINGAIRDMVLRNHGDAAWTRIREAAGVEASVFIRNEPYPDDMTYRLVAAAAQVLGTDTEQVLELFGEHWILHTAREGYGALLGAAGSSFGDFLVNLPDFHGRVAMIFPNLKPPRFECTDITGNSLRLHYHSERKGLGSFVIGLLHGLGKRFGTTVDVSRAQPGDSGSGSGHDVFEVRWS